MIVISKDEKDELLKRGCVWHKDIHKTHSRWNKYFLVESKKNIDKLGKLRGMR